MSDRNELNNTIAQILTAELAIDPERAQRAARAITRDWDITRVDTPESDIHPLAEQKHGHYLRITTDWQPETPGETADRQAREAARHWAWGDHDDPPPERVNILDLLEQDTWWRARVEPWTEWEKRHACKLTEPVRLQPADDPDDPWRDIKVMDLDHKVALLAWLRRNANSLHARLATRFGDAPDDVWFSWEREDPHEWLEDQPLVKALVWQTTPVAESPLTWRPLSEVESGALVIVRRHGRDEQIWARRIAGEWWQIIENGWTRIPPAWIRETGTKWRLPWLEEAEAAGVLPIEADHQLSDTDDHAYDTELCDAYVRDVEDY
jgi:hypothetical protein